ncbi:MAG: c-type cytochrome, partial [Flavobacteriaceae bacterium]|nr:c-type cytochrome [Flavobacteriaceae bacterium]
LIRATGDLRKELGLSSSSKIKPILKNAYTIVLDQNSTTEQRLENLKFISLDNFENRANVLYLLINNKMPIALQKEAMGQLRNSNNKTIAPKLLELWSTLGSETRRTATDILLYKSYNHPVLLTAMENNQVSLGEFNLDLERRRVLLFSRNPDTKKRAKLLFSDAGVVQRKEVIEKMKPALKLEGDNDNGKILFTRVCANCHVFGTIGIEVGPSLTEISRKSKEALLHDILDPNSAVDAAYLNHKLVTKDGNIYMGLVFNETDKEITLKMMGGTTETIKKDEIESLTSTGASLMFEGLENSLTLQEMADLLTFLQLAN